MSSKSSNNLIKRLANSKLATAIFFTSFSAVIMLLAFLIYVIPLNNGGDTPVNLFKATELYFSLTGLNFKISFANYIAIAILGVNALLLILSTLLLFLKKNRAFCSIFSAVNLILSLVLAVINVFSNVFTVGSMVILIAIALLCIIQLIFLTIVKSTLNAQRDDKYQSVLTDKAKKAYKITLLVTSSISLVVLILMLFLPVYSEVNGGTYNFLSALNSQNLLSTNNIPLLVGLLLFTIFIFIGILKYASMIPLFSHDKDFTEKASSLNIYSTVLSLVFFFFGFGISFVFNAFKLSENKLITSSYIPFLINIVVLLVALVMKSQMNISNFKMDFQKISNPKKKIFKFLLIACNVISLASLLLTLILPVYQIEGEEATRLITQLYYPSGDIKVMIPFLVIFIAIFVSLIFFALSLAYFKSDVMFGAKANKFSLILFILDAVVFLYALVIVFINKLTAQTNVTTIAYIPAIIGVAVYVISAFFQGALGVRPETALKKNGTEIKRVKGLKFEILIYLLLLTAATCSILFVNIITITFTAGDNINTEPFTLTGYKMLPTLAEADLMQQILGFLMVAIVAVSLIIFLVAFVSFVSGSNVYYKICKIGAFTNFLLATSFGLFGLFSVIASRTTVVLLAESLDKAGYPIPVDYNVKISSQTVFIFVVSLAIFIFMLIRKQFNLQIVESQQVDFNLANPEELENKEKTKEEGENPDENIEKEKEPEVINRPDFDPCPAFSEIDAKNDEFKNLYDSKMQQVFQTPTLPNLVDFIVTYAKESRLHLSYTKEDIANFIAGLGASRLTILQGMSGTGKTSLPKIFTEALLANCEIVEVESSWRDKNELLGYYNEFSKTFTPKKFTQCLYKATLNQDVITLIVLDEMNLSRIEYYFSDFLSLMENEEGHREIKLLNVKLDKVKDNTDIPYLGLSEGHTIKVPSNVWFIGTANRDESTFAISDKVYDRAQTMNFNKRAPKIHDFTQPIPQQFLQCQQFRKLLDDAKQSGFYEVEDDEVIASVEELLAPFNISFGNRILNQMEDFVKVYCACFDDSKKVVKEAVERILLSKVVAKLENKVVENKEQLATEFDRLNLKQCSSFIRKLNED